MITKKSEMIIKHDFQMPNFRKQMGIESIKQAWAICT